MGDDDYKAELAARKGEDRRAHKHLGNSASHSYVGSGFCRTCRQERRRRRLEIRGGAFSPFRRAR
jgi:hypothetical protein